MKFRRKKSDAAVEESDVETTPAPGDADPADDARADAPRPSGPWDASEVDLDPEDGSRVDLGSLLVTGRPGLELQLQVDEESQEIAAVLLLGQEGAVELRAFAAPRNADIWDEVRRSIAAEASRQGGTATEADGPFGRELHVVMNVTTPDGQPATQTSRVLGITGPRWLLRATLLGRPAVEPDPEDEVEAALRDVVVVRGNDAMAPGDPLPLRMPPNAQPISG